MLFFIIQYDLDHYSVIKKFNVIKYKYPSFFQQDIVVLF